MIQYPKDFCFAEDTKRLFVSWDYSGIGMVVRIVCGTSFMYAINVFWGDYFVMDGIFNLLYVIGLLSGLGIIIWMLLPLFYWILVIYRIFILGFFSFWSKNGKRRKQ